MKSLLLAGLAALALLPQPAPAASGDDGVFRDPVDGRFDTSRWLLERKGFLPVPIVITEPALGYGGGVGLLFFHRNLGDPAAARGPGGEGAFVPPDITGGGAMGTENGSKAGGLFHLGYSEGRRWRYLGAAAYGSLNLAWYGSPGLGQGVQSEGLDFNIDGTFVLADVRRRFGDTEWWAGMRFVGIDTRTGFDRLRPDEIPSRQLDSALAGLGAVVEYDARDNIFTPNRGLRAVLEATRFDESVGSDFDFDRARLAVNSFHPWGDRVVVGVRAEAEGVHGDVPFYARPFIFMRGIPALRYQGDRVALLEVEGRFRLDGRWSLVGFAGAGRAAAGSSELRDAPSRVTKGVGFRYLIARALGLHVGIDVARGPEENAFYLVVGNMWR